MQVVEARPAVDCVDGTPASRSGELASIIQGYWNIRSDTYSNGVLAELEGDQLGAWIGLFSERLGAPTLAGEVPGAALTGADAPKRVLDIGCGPGFFEVVLSRLGHEVIAVDSSRAMLDTAGVNVLECGSPELVTFMRGDAECLSLEDESFDAVVSRNVTWLMQHPRQAYREWMRVLKPGGRLLAFDANWYRYLVDEEVNRQRKLDQKDVATLGWSESERASSEQEIACENIALHLPLTKENRPSWDVAVLRQLGFSSVSVDEGAWRKLWAPGEKAFYATSPLFMIEAVK